MQLRRSDLADLTYFLEIAKHRNFRRAGLELGISASALSHALRGLEERFGVRLLNRTSRSVTLTAAGEELRTAILEPFDAIGRAVDVLNRFRDAPVGRIRLSVPTEAADFVVAPVLPRFLERYPDVEIEISVSNQLSVPDSVLTTPSRNFLVRAFGFTVAGATMWVPIITVADAEARDRSAQGRSSKRHSAIIMRGWMSK
jgi:hypothetical protein